MDSVLDKDQETNGMLATSPVTSDAPNEGSAEDATVAKNEGIHQDLKNGQGDDKIPPMQNDSDNETTNSEATDSNTVPVTESIPSTENDGKATNEEETSHLTSREEAQPNTEESNNAETVNPHSGHDNSQQEDREMLETPRATQSSHNYQETHPGSVPLPGNQLNQLEKGILAKQQQQPPTSHETSEKSQPVPTQTTAKSNLHQVEQDIISKQNASQHSLTNGGATQPGAVAVAGNSLNQMQDDILSKQRASNGSTTSRPGAVAVNGNNGNSSIAPLDQMEQEVLAKQRAVQGMDDSSNKSHLDRLEQDVLAKRRAKAVAGNNNSLDQMEVDIRAKQQAAFPARSKAVQPGAVAVTGQRSLDQLEQDLQAKHRTSYAAATTTAAHPSSSRSLNQLENDIISKRRASQKYGSSQPGAVAVAGNSLDQMEQDIVAKQQQQQQQQEASGSNKRQGPPAINRMYESSSSSLSLTQAEQDILAKQRGAASQRRSQPGAVAVPGSLAHLEHNVTAKGGASLDVSAASQPGTMVVPGRNSIRAEQEALAKQDYFDSSSSSQVSAFAASNGSSMNQMQQDTLAKQRRYSSSRKQEFKGSVAERGEQQALAEPSGSFLLKRSESQPGAIAVSGDSLDQMEADVLAKQFKSHPGSTAIVGESLGQVEQDILMKQRGANNSNAAIPKGQSQPGAVAVNGSDLSQVETEILAKQANGTLSIAVPSLNSQGGHASFSRQLGLVAAASNLSQVEPNPNQEASSNALGALASTRQKEDGTSSNEKARINLNQIEQDNSSKRNFMRLHKRQPGAVAMSAESIRQQTNGGAVNHLEQDILAKREAASTRSLTALSNHRDVHSVHPHSGEAELSRAESDVLAKQLSIGPSAVHPGAVSVSDIAQSQSNQEMDEHQQETLEQPPSRLTSVDEEVSQVERDLMVKQEMRNNLGMSRPDANTCSASSINQLQQDLLAKQQLRSSLGISNPGAFPSSRPVNQLQDDILAKQNSQATLSSTPPTRGNDENGGPSYISNFVTSVAAKNAAYAPSKTSGTNPTSLNSNAESIVAGFGSQASQLRHELHELEDDLRSGLGGIAANNLNADPSVPGSAMATMGTMPIYDLESDVCSKTISTIHLPPNVVASVESSHFSQQITNDTQLNAEDEYFDEPRFPSSGTTDGIDTVPSPISIPYEPYAVSEAQPEAPRAMPTLSGDSNEVPSVDVPSGGIEAYVPPAVVEAAGVSLALSTEEEERLFKERRKKYVLGGALCVCLVIVAIIIPTVLAVTKEKEPEAREILPTVAPSSAPSEMPSGAPTTSIFAEFINDVIMPLNVSAEAAFEDVNSPQYQAALWLILEDSQTYWIENDISIQDSRAIQRFALATLHYSTDGSNWAFCGESSTNCPTVTWLSGVDECTWFAVTCDDNGQVETLNFLTPLEGNFLDGTLPREVSLLKDLKRFIAPKNQLQGYLREPFHGLYLLDTIVLLSNELNGTLPMDTILQNSNLGVLNLGFNQISGTIPEELGATKLSHLQLHENSLTSSIPSTIGNASRLQILQFNGNNLEGSIPSSLYELSSLSIFSVSNNTKFGGSIDSRISQLPMLARFEAGNTDLTGSIPDEIYQLTQLTHIVLSNSSMYGPLKQDLHLLNSTLRRLILNDNAFTGEIPTALDVMTSLELLYLDENKFVGTISDKVCQQRGVGFEKLFRLFADCNVVCNCNDKCPNRKRHLAGAVFGF